MESSEKVIKASEINPRFKYEISKMHGGEKLCVASSVAHALQIVQLPNLATLIDQDR